MYVLAGFTVGWIAVPVLAGIGLAAVFQLEVINYLEHYGLERRPLDNGRLERLGPHHAWDDNHLLSSWLLANLTHHADHTICAPVSATSGSAWAKCAPTRPL
jgi:alkane 1-monooxygenase